MGMKELDPKSIATLKSKWAEKGAHKRLVALSKIDDSYPLRARDVIGSIFVGAKTPDQVAEIASPYWQVIDASDANGKAGIMAVYAFDEAGGVAAHMNGPIPPDEFRSALKETLGSSFTYAMVAIVFAKKDNTSFVLIIGADEEKEQRELLLEITGR